MTKPGLVCLTILILLSAGSNLDDSHQGCYLNDYKYARIKIFPGNENLKVSSAK